MSQDNADTFEHIGDAIEQVEKNIEESKKKKKFDDSTVFHGMNSYGEKFDGVYMKVGELREDLPKFKEYYYERRKESPNYSAMKILAEFNEMISPRRFYPYKNQYRQWRKRWDADILSIIHNAKVVAENKVRSIVQTRDVEGGTIVPSYESLELGTQTLGGELINDAMGILKKDQEMGEDYFEDELLVKRRKYVLDVFKYVGDSVNKKEALRLKKAQGQRETASFMMDLLRASTAGKISDEQMELIRDSVPTVNEEPTQTQTT